jgi:hypothetical protein
LRQAAEIYDPQSFRAPLIIEHETNGVSDAQIHKMPWAFGTPEHLEFSGGVLRAGFETVAPEFLEWVVNGNLISVSPAFYLPEDPRNPTPGKLHLRHIGALGSQPPAIKGRKGLQTLLAEFSEAEGKEAVLDLPASHSALAGLFSEAPKLPVLTERAVKEIFEQLFIEKGIVPPAIESLEDSGMEKLEQLAGRALRLALKKTEMAAAELAEATGLAEDRVTAIWEGGEASLEEIEKLLEAITPDSPEYTEPTAKELALVAREKELAQREQQMRERELAEFMEPLEADGRILPGEKAQLTGVLRSLQAIEPIEFTEGSSQVVKSPAECLKNFLSGLKSRVNYGEAAPAAEEVVIEAEFTEPPGYSANAEKVKVLARAKSYAKQNNCSVDEGLRAVGYK